MHQKIKISWTAVKFCLVLLFLITSLSGSVFSFSLFSSNSSPKSCDRVTPKNIKDTLIKKDKLQPNDDFRGAHPQATNCSINLSQDDIKKLDSSELKSDEIQYQFSFKVECDESGYASETVFENEKFVCKERLDGKKKYYEIDFPNIKSISILYPDYSSNSDPKNFKKNLSPIIIRPTPKKSNKIKQGNDFDQIVPESFSKDGA